MSFGTKGCMYNCGDSCTGECVKSIDEVMNKEELNPLDIKYGLIALDPEQEGEMKDVLHFCGYWEEPGEAEAKDLHRELKEDESFGLTEIADRLVIIPAPDWLVKEYIDMVKEEEE